MCSFVFFESEKTFKFKLLTAKIPLHYRQLLKGGLWQPSFLSSNILLHLHYASQIPKNTFHSCLSCHKWWLLQKATNSVAILPLQQSIPMEFTLLIVTLYLTSFQIQKTLMVIYLKIPQSLLPTIPSPS